MEDWKAVISISLMPRLIIVCHFLQRYKKISQSDSTFLQAANTLRITSLGS